MRPVLFEVLGVPINSYGVSKVAAALVAGYLLARELVRDRSVHARGRTLPATAAG